MRVLEVKGLWQKVFRNVGETSFGANRVTINLDLNPRREMTYNVISAKKIGHMKRDCPEKKKGGSASKNKEGIKVCKCSGRRRLREW